MAEPQPRRLKDFEPLTPAERQVLEGLDTGETIWIGFDVPNANAGEDRLIRARFLRWVILGCAGSDQHRVHEKGVHIAGTLITGEGADRKTHAALDLMGAEVSQDVLLTDCRFTAMPEMIGARMQSLILNRSHLPGLRADRLETQGNVAMDSVESSGEIRLLGTQIGGDLDCDGAKLRNEGGLALNADGARITGAFFWRAGAKAEGAIDLTAAEIGAICDDPACWPDKGDLLLDRCRYGAFTGTGVSAKERLRWLGLQDESRFGKEFWPQPYEHCAKVLREMGHQDDAREILIEKERRLRQAKRDKEPDWPLRQVRLIWDTILRYTVFYGHRPLFALVWLLVFWVLGQNAYQAAWQADAFKPNNPFILRSAEWVRCGVDTTQFITLATPGEGRAAQVVTGLRDGVTRQECFANQPEGQGFPEFHPGIYSFDVLFPLVEIEQQANWVPDDDNAQGRMAKWMMYLQIIMGWALSLLAVAGLSGIIKSD